MANAIRPHKGPWARADGYSSYAHISGTECTEAGTWFGTLSPEDLDILGTSENPPMVGFGTGNVIIPAIRGTHEIGWNPHLLESIVAPSDPCPPEYIHPTNNIAFCCTL